MTLIVATCFGLLSGLFAPKQSKSALLAVWAFMLAAASVFQVIA